MKTQTIYVDACTSTGIAIGRRNTYATEQIVFGLAALVQQYGAGSATLMVLRPTDTTPYPAVTSQSGTELTWTVSATDTSVPGTGECELYWYVNGGLAKSVIFPLTIQRDIITEPIDEPPEPYQTWVDDLTELGAETLQNAQAAAQSAADAEAAKIAAQGAQTGAEAAQTAAETAQGKAEDAQEAAESSKTDAEAAARQAEEALEEFTTPTASANTLQPTEPATASYANGHFTFGIPQGVPGDPGVTPDFSIGNVQTLQPTEPATASITGTAEHPVLNLGIPQGVQGDPATNLVQSVNGKTGAVVLGAGDIGYDGETTYPDASVGKELGTINSALTSLSAVTEIIDTASGAIASFPDGSGLPMRSLVAEINPVQDLHGYDAPWPAGGGVNKWNYLVATPAPGEQGLTSISVDDSGLVTISGTWTPNNPSATAVGMRIFGNVPYIENTNVYAFDKNTDASNCISSVRWNNTSGSLAIDLINLVSGQNYDIKFRVVICDSSITPASWTPYSNICPISGWTGLSGQRTGANIFGGEEFRDAILAAVSNSTTGTDATGKYVTVAASAASNDKTILEMPFKENTQYTFIIKAQKSNANSATNLAIDYTDGAVGYVSFPSGISADTVYTFVMTTAANKTVKHIYTIWGSGTTYFYYENTGLFEGVLTADDFAPYTGEAISVSFGQTVYGGTDEVVSGNGTSTMGMVDLGDLLWSNVGNNIYSCALQNMKAPTTYEERKQGIISSSYPVSNSVSISESMDDKSMLRFAGNIYVRDTAYSDGNAFKEGVSGVQLCYELATPQSFTHTGQSVDTLVGQNNVWVDTGDVSVTYQANLKGYIDKVLGA